MKEDEVVSWLCDQASAVLQNPSDMGSIEKAVDRVSLQCRRLALQCLVQQQAAGQDLNCPRCGAALEKQVTALILESGQSFTRAVQQPAVGVHQRQVHIDEDIGVFHWEAKTSVGQSLSEYMGTNKLSIGHRYATDRGRAHSAKCLPAGLRHKLETGCVLW